LREALGRSEPIAPASAQAWDWQPIEAAVTALAAQIDPIEAASAAPVAGRSFPSRSASGSPCGMPPSLSFFTLRKMADGGIYDQVGGGFCAIRSTRGGRSRTSRDALRQRRVAVAVLRRPSCCRRTAFRTGGRASPSRGSCAEMRAPAGGFYSALDADSRVKRGGFNVWSRDEVVALLTATSSRWSRPLRFDGAPNFEGRWHLRVAKSLMP